MNITSLFPRRGLLALLAVLTLSGCRVLEHRHVQRDFEDAVRAETAQDPFNTGYEYVLETVTLEYIAKLDARLRPNAWMMRGMAAWRLKEYTSALECYTKGEQEPALVRGSRDDIVLNLLPALVIDSEQMDQPTARTNSPLSATEYEPFQAAYKLAIERLKSVHGRLGPNTPEDVTAYYFYQRWRILQHWASLITRIDSRDPNAQKAALDKADQALGMSLEQAVQQARDKVPASHPLRALIRAHGGG
jgi:hypothetical protein